VLEPVESDLRTLEAIDVRFSGYGGQPVRAWLLLPAHRSDPLPTIVEFLGYGGGRGSPLDWLVWASAGYAHFVMDTRGQGSVWLAGDTPDVEPAGSNPQYPGFLTRGILDPRTYYYRRVFVDAAMALGAAREHPSVDPARVIVAGTSQGGGIALAAAALDPTVRAALIDVPFLTHFRRALEVTDEAPYSELRHSLTIHRLQEEQVSQRWAISMGGTLPHEPQRRLSSPSASRTKSRHRRRSSRHSTRTRAPSRSRCGHTAATTRRSTSTWSNGSASSTGSAFAQGSSGSPCDSPPNSHARR